MVVAACVPVIILNTAYGVQRRKIVRTQVAQLFGASRLQLLREIIFWEALPQTLIGMRVAISYAVIVEIVCEMFMGTQRGLGQRVFEAYNTYSIVDLYAIILLVGITGYAINKAFVMAEQRMVHWVG
jgi:NitT/TauT family transport system permease protein